MKKIFFLNLILCLSIFAKAQTIEEANKLRDSFKETEALAKYNEILKNDANNYDAICAASYMNSRIGWRTIDATAKKNYYTKSKELADKAIKLKPNDAESNFVMSVAMGRIAEIASAKERVAASRDIKKYADLALKYNPKHEGAWHVLGKWNFRVANLSFAEEAAAKLLFGGIPDKASNERAIECINNAIKYKNPNEMMCYYDLAQVYNTMGNKEEAKSALKKASNIYTANQDNAIVRRDVDKMLSNIK